MNTEERLVSMIARDLGIKVSNVGYPMFKTEEDAQTFRALLAEEYGVILDAPYPSKFAYADFVPHYNGVNTDESVEAFYKSQFTYWTL